MLRMINAPRPAVIVNYRAGALDRAGESARAGAPPARATMPVLAGSRQAAAAILASSVMLTSGTGVQIPYAKGHFCWSCVSCRVSIDP